MTAPATAATPPLSARAVLLIELALAMGGFAIGTGEFAIMGLMPNVAAGLGISEPQVGNVISTYALGVVVGAPLLPLMVAAASADSAPLSAAGSALARAKRAACCWRCCLCFFC